MPTTATSALLSDYDFAAEITGESEVTTMQLAAGGYAVLFVGVRGLAVCVMPDPTSETGWTQEMLPPGERPVRLAGVVGPDGAPLVFGAGAEEWGPYVWTTTRGDDGMWSPWSMLDWPTNFLPMFGVADLRTVTTRGASDVVAVLGDGNGWALSLDGWQSIGPVSAELLAGATVAGQAGIVTVISTEEHPWMLVSYARPYGDSYTILETSFQYSTLAAADRLDRGSTIVMGDNGSVSEQPAIALLDGAHVDAGYVVVDNTTVATQLAAADETTSTPLTFYAVGTDTQVHVGRLGETSTPNGMMDVGLTLQSPSVALDAAGAFELVGTDASAPRLLRAWPATETGSWEVDDVELPTTALLLQYAHSSVFTVTDDDGGPRALQAVNVYADQTVSLTAGNVVGLAGPQSPLAATTDASGRLRVTVPTDRLATCRLRVTLATEAASSPPLADRWFSPNGATCARLAAMTAADVATLAPAASNPDQILQALQALGNAGYSDAVIAPATPMAPGWQLTIDGQGARFRELDLAEVDAIHAAPRPDTNVEGFIDFFEDIAQAVVEGVQTAITWTVTTVNDVIDVLIEATIDLIDWATSFTASLVEEGMAVVDTVLAAAGAVIQGIVDFFGWLFSGLREDIWRVKGEFERLLTTGLAKLVELVRSLGAPAHTFFADMADWVDDHFQELIDDLGSDQLDPPEAVALGDVQSVLDDVGSPATWLFDKIMSLGAGIDTSFDIARATIDRIEAFLDQVQDDVVAIVQTAIDGFVASVRAYATSTAALGDVLLATLLELGQDAAVAVLRAVDAVVQAALELMAGVLDDLTRDVLARPISSTILQGLYDLINPGPSESITLIRMASLLIAMPTTIGSRAICGESVYPPSAEQDSAVELSDTLRPWMWWSGLGFLAPWTPIDIYLDLRKIPVVPPPPAPTPAPTPAGRVVNGVCANVIPIAIMLAAWPGGPFTLPGSPGEKTKMMAYGVGWAPLLYNLVVSAKSGFGATARAPGYVWGFTAAWVLALIADVVKCARLDDVLDTDWAMAFLGPMPGICKPMRYGSPDVQISLGLIDLVCDAANGATRMASA